MQFVIPVNTHTHTHIHSRMSIFYLYMYLSVCKYKGGATERVAVAVFQIMEKRTIQQRDSVFPLARLLSHPFYAVARRRVAVYTLYTNCSTRVPSAAPHTPHNIYIYSTTVDFIREKFGERREKELE